MGNNGGFVPDRAFPPLFTCPESRGQKMHYDTSLYRTAKTPKELLDLLLWGDGFEGNPNVWPGTWIEGEINSRCPQEAIDRAVRFRIENPDLAPVPSTLHGLQNWCIDAQKFMDRRRAMSEAVKNAPCEPIRITYHKIDAEGIEPETAENSQDTTPDPLKQPVTIHWFLEYKCKVSKERVLTAVDTIRKAKETGKIEYPAAAVEPRQGVTGQWYLNDLLAVWPIWCKEIKTLPRLITE
jgi:hypothetical protein